MTDYGFMIFWSPEGLGILCSRCDEEILHVEEGEEGAIEHDALVRCMESHRPNCRADQ
jgi:hypothetical protein